VDLRGFSRLTYNLPSAELLRLLGEYQQIVAQGVFDNGGVVDKFLGDGVLAHFGIAGDLSNISASALKAAEQIDADLQEWCQKKNQSGLGVAFGIALTQGTVTFGVIGHPDRMEITVLGESVNRAAKYEKYTKELGHRLIIDPELFARALSEGHAVSGEYQQFENVHVPGLPNSQHIVARIS
jgi:adenylate cyclase